MGDKDSGAMRSWYNIIKLFVSIFPFSFSTVLPYGMDDSKYCSKDSRRLIWIEEGKGVIIIGKSTPPASSMAAAVCNLIFGSKSDTKNSLLVKFESFYINDCGISLTLKQSPSSVFDQDVEQLASLSCEMPTPPPFYSSKNRFVMFSLEREDKYMRNYNFRINITITEGAPRSGPSTAVIILIAVGLLSAIVVISILLVKHIKLKRVGRERRAERALERAIHVYNSQELHRGVPYTTVPSHRTCPTHERLQYGSNNSSNGHNHNLLIVQNHSRSNSRTNSDINCSETDIHRPSLNTSEENRLNESNCEFDTESLPPSYEEALEMPKPSLPESPLYANM
ncbi:hypothetical protein LOTGIDRAFT_238733 [Lottia gigantea]|uniref:Uncharacterized protein n=1 Tax=Lottia gigantea TaxID=225164 RepID=V4AXG2_LOTGI|nr:hypothetical protein LOTGIDRAFT_238733 [Lottia gigantea]ESO99735.1 hypothetical protein LOTGIDRAFT_238733 [Lottia gigantea]